jgi:glyoxylase-like metal-dependent hydrolase (beta-lactamase superfamily II)/rhodanese-related sulfurtransferase
LAQAAYYIEHNGEAAIIDPLREATPYIERAHKDNAKIKYIFETHFHADFVSGHIDLAKKTDAKIVFGPTANPNYEVIVAKDNQEFKVGGYTIKVIHTPGHTMESTTYLLIDEHGKQHGIITGDTLFIGDVGRPDLAQEVVSDLSEDKLAGFLFDSLRNKIMPLDDSLIVYPSHGAGSACGKNMSKETTDTLGNQKKTNYALRADMTKEEFVKELLDGLASPPKYFPQNVLMNINGYDSLDTVIEKSKSPLSSDDFEKIANETDAVILDVRHQNDFVNGFIPKSIFIGIDGGFAPWVGALIADVNQKILLVTPIGREEEVITRLSRVGFDNVLGYLDGSFETWKNSGKEIDSLKSVQATDLKKAIDTEETLIFDVRKDGEYTSSHIENAIHTPLSKLNEYLNEYPSNTNFFVHCAGGYRSVIAASILKSRGIHNLIDVKGGFGAIKKLDIKLTDEVCPSTLK